VAWYYEYYCILVGIGLTSSLIFLLMPAAKSEKKVAVVQPSLSELWSLLSTKNMYVLVPLFVYRAYSSAMTRLVFSKHLAGYFGTITQET